MSHKHRLYFIDWMKAIGMFAIVLGHFFPPSIQYFTYAFSVQLFFFVSGFLFKRNPDNRTFWCKNWQGLIVPYLILGGVNLLYKIIRNPDAHSAICSAIGLALGISNVDNHGGCGGLWFVFTLLLLKVIFQQIALLKSCILILIMIPIVFIYHETITDSSYEFWGFGMCSVFIAYPFFLLGYLLSNFYYDKIFILSFLFERKYRILSFSLGVFVWILLFIIAPLNGVVYMIYGGYGIHFSMFVLYSFIGIMGAYFFAVAFSYNRRINGIATISSGSIVILAFQGYFIERIAPRLEVLCSGKGILYECGSVVASIIIMLLFVPIIKFCQRYIPVVLGNRK